MTNNLTEKINKFNDLCGDWDYRNIDMTNSHLASIDVLDTKKKYIIVSCELYSTSVDEYVSCSVRAIKNKKIVKEFMDLDLENYEDVLNFFSDINSHIDWDKVDEKLSKEEQKLIKKYDLDNEIDEELEQDF